MNMRVLGDYSECVLFPGAAKDQVIQPVDVDPHWHACWTQQLCVIKHSPLTIPSLFIVPWMRIKCTMYEWTELQIGHLLKNHTATLAHATQICSTCVFYTTVRLLLYRQYISNHLGIQRVVSYLTRALVQFFHPTLAILPPYSSSPNDFLSCSWRSSNRMKLRDKL